MPSADEKVCVGAIAGARGLRGEVKLKSFTANPQDIASYGTLYDEASHRSFDLRVTGQSKGCLLARIKGVNDRNGAEALKGVALYAPRTALPELEEEEYYYADLVGLVAQLADGEKLGTVKAVHDFGAGTILEVGGNKSMMVPFTRQAVPRVDVKAGHVIIDPPMETEANKDDEEESEN